MSNVALRQNIANAVSALRRVRPRIPFYELKAHTVPTKWILYRGLLRASPGENIIWRIKWRFRRNMYLTSPAKTRVQLEFAQHLLDTSLLAKTGNERAKAVLARYDQLLAFKRKVIYWNKIYDEEAKWMERMRNRPIMTGGYLHPTLYNPPLPDLKPQPSHISGMIVTRKRVRARRIDDMAWYVSIREDLMQEAAFEDELAKLHPDNFSDTRIFSWALRSEWESIPHQHADQLYAYIARDHERGEMKFTPEMIEMIRGARRDKIANKTKERERERRGEILKRTIKRARSMPPGRVWSMLTPEQRHEDYIGRLPSEAGYVAAIKRKRGQKLRDDKTWRLEEGLPEDQERLDEMEAAIREANDRKRHNAHHPLAEGYTSA